MDLLTKISSIIFFHNICDESLLESINEAIDFGIADLECSYDGFSGNVSFNDHNGSFTFIEWGDMSEDMVAYYKEKVFSNPAITAEVFIEASDCGPGWVTFTVVTTVKIYKEDLLSLLCKN